MKRLARILLNALTVLSLLLLVATVVLWVRGQWRVDSLGWTEHARVGATRVYFGLASGGGCVQAHTVVASPQFADRLGEGGWSWYSGDRTPRRPASLTRWGFACASDDSPRLQLKLVVFPTWLAAVIFALLPSTRLALAIRRRQHKGDGDCPMCGYDLRATPERCPECGKIPTK